MHGAVAFAVLLAVVQASLGSKEGAADWLAGDGDRIAIMIVGGPLVLSMDSIKGALESFKKHVVAPLTARGSSLDFFVCLDSTDPEDERELRPLIEDSLGKPQLMVFEQDCDETCQNVMAVHEAHGERDDGEYLLAPRQFFRRNACFQRLAAHERAEINSGKSRYSFIMMARPDLQWLADFPDDGLDPNQVGLKYSRANGVNLTLAHLSHPVALTGENTCSDEMMRHRCITVDDTLAFLRVSCVPTNGGVHSAACGPPLGGSRRNVRLLVVCRGPADGIPDRAVGAVRRQTVCVHPAWAYS
jgi:hypothetical protein